MNNQLEALEKMLKHAVHVFETAEGFRKNTLRGIGNLDGGGYRIHVLTLSPYFQIDKSEIDGTIIELDSDEYELEYDHSGWVVLNPAKSSSYSGLFTFPEAYEYGDMKPCTKHKTYKVMKRPTADCARCRELWIDRCLKEVGYRNLAAHSAQKNCVSMVPTDNYVLYWEESGKCKCISTLRHNFWFTVDDLEGFHQRYSVIV